MKCKRLRPLIFALFCLTSLFVFVARLPGFAPWAADTLRSFFGPAFVAYLEDVVYTGKDVWEQFRHQNDPPKSYWQIPKTPTKREDIAQDLSPAAPSNPGESTWHVNQNVEPSTHPEPLQKPWDDLTHVSSLSASTPFPPATFLPPFPKVATPNDGHWVSMPDDLSDTPALVKTIVHPDEKRGYSVVAVVAMNLAALQINAVAGTKEPESEHVSSKDRPGKVPKKDWAKLVAAFNGGWQAIHGHFGMMVDGLEFLPPKDASCTLVLYKNGGVDLGTWTNFANMRNDIQSFRQTPRCLKEGGILNSRLYEAATGWGVSVDGDTIIRRSAVGLDRRKTIFFYGVGDSQSAKSIALALSVSGADTVAELDVNASFPRFLMYSHRQKNSSPAATSSPKKEPVLGEPNLPLNQDIHEPIVQESLIPSDYKSNEYVGRPWYRDFFYVVRK